MKNIHSFGDENEKVERLFALKERLRYRYNIILFIIEDSKKYFYYRD